jgi:hypothetical protein
MSASGGGIPPAAGQALRVYPKLPLVTTPTCAARVLSYVV